MIYQSANVLSTNKQQEKKAQKCNYHIRLDGELQIVFSSTSVTL